MITAIKRRDYKDILEFKNPASDFEIFNLDDPDIERKTTARKDASKLSVLSFSGPFEALSRKLGRLNFLKEIARTPEKAAFNLLKESRRILNSMQLLLAKGMIFDAAWIWSDLAYKGGLFFSPEFYKRNLFPLHKKLVDFLNSHGMPVIFHSDGSIEQLIPYLVEAGVSAIYPLDAYADMDMAELKRRYKRKLVFLE